MGKRPKGDAQRDWARRYIAGVTGLADVECPSDVVERVLESLSLEAERSSTNDTCDGLVREPTRGSRRGTSVQPPIIDTLIKQSVQLAVPRTPWPGGRPFALCLSHDVDVVTRRMSISRIHRGLKRLRPLEEPSHAVREVARYLYRALREPFRADPLGCYEKWLSLEADYGFRSTWFFLPEDIIRPHRYDMDYRYDDVVTFEGARTTVAGMMRAIADAGWEIGLHGSFRSASDSDMLRNEREQVERAVGRQVTSVRQHYLKYDVHRTPSHHALAHLLCDSTHGFNQASGFRAEASFPYWCWDSVSDNAVPVLELPLHVMDSALFNDAGLAYDESTAEAHVLSMLDAVAEVGGCLVVNWHPNYIEVPRYWRTYATLLREAAARGAWGCSCAELYRAWIAWEAKIGLPPVGPLQGE